MPQIVAHRLRIVDPENTPLFYQDKLGFQLLGQRDNNTAVHFFFRCGEASAMLELIYDPDFALDIIDGDADAAGYWKMALSVADLDVARAQLIANDVAVGEAFEVEDVAYMAHLRDPEGYCIELIQHRFLKNHISLDDTVQVESSLGVEESELGTASNFSLITYRVLDIDKSLDFYQNSLGMTLLSRQRVDKLGFTLYFLAFTDETPPNEDIDSIENREWLWARPYTQIELQHRDEPRCAYYNVQESAGFAGVVFDGLSADIISQADDLLLIDPDGYRLHLLD